MLNHDIKRIARLTSILTQLQTKRVLTATVLADRFGVSVRTIYRDIKTLEQAGVPVLTKDGKGYTLMDGYKIPPVMFTESEANALILAQQLVLMNSDISFIKDYSDAIEKIKAVLRQPEKDKVNLLTDRTRLEQHLSAERRSNNLSQLQNALTNFFLAKMEYVNEAGVASTRVVEPFALLNTNENWLMIAWCQLRKSFRFFRIDRIVKLQVLSQKFTPQTMTLQDFFDNYQ